MNTDILKSQFLSMFMLKNMNNTSSHTKGSENENIFAMLYFFIITQLVEGVFKVIPVIYNHIIDYFKLKYGTKILKKFEDETETIKGEPPKIKSSSITIPINIVDNNNVLGQAMLDYITNYKSVKHVIYDKQNFILNQNETMKIHDDIYVKMLEKSDNISSVSSIITQGQQSNASAQQAVVQTLEIFSFCLTIPELRQFVDDVKEKYVIKSQNKLGDKKYFFDVLSTNTPGAQFVFNMKQFNTNRSFKNLFGEEIDLIKKRVLHFINNKKWYNEKGIPYTLGLLLSGEPGTGKTSTIKCLAKETNRHIININLNNNITKSQLENIFNNEHINVFNVITGKLEAYNIPLEHRIYVFEDVDCQSDIVKSRDLLNQQNNTISNNVYNQQPQQDQQQQQNMNINSKMSPKFQQMLNSKPPPQMPVNNVQQPAAPVNKQTEKEKENKIDLSFLLNLLDGIIENPGRIIIMTSNHPEVLDKALIRPGRIDIISKFSFCSSKTTIDMFEFFYDIKLSEFEKEQINNYKEKIFTPAELSRIMFEFCDDYKEALKEINDKYNSHIKKNKPLNDSSTIDYNSILSECNNIIKKTPLEDYDEIFLSDNKKTSDMLKNSSILFSKLTSETNSKTSLIDTPLPLNISKEEVTKHTDEEELKKLYKLHSGYRIELSNKYNYIEQILESDFSIKCQIQLPKFIDIFIPYDEITSDENHFNNIVRIESMYTDADKFLSEIFNIIEPLKVGFLMKKIINDGINKEDLIKRLSNCIEDYNKDNFVKNMRLNSIKNTNNYIAVKTEEKLDTIDFSTFDDITTNETENTDIKNNDKKISNLKHLNTIEDLEGDANKNTYVDDRELNGEFLRMKYESEHLLNNQKLIDSILV